MFLFNFKMKLINLKKFIINELQKLLAKTTYFVQTIKCLYTIYIFEKLLGFLGGLSFPPLGSFSHYKVTTLPQFPPPLITNSSRIRLAHSHGYVSIASFLAMRAR